MDNCVKCHERPIHVKKSSLCKKCYGANWVANREKKLKLPRAVAWKSTIEEMEDHIRNLNLQLRIAEATKERFIMIAKTFLKDIK